MSVAVYSLKADSRERLRGEGPLPLREQVTLVLWHWAGLCLADVQAQNALA